MTIQLLIFILFAGLLQGLLLMGIFALRKSITTFHVLISLYVLTLLMQVFFKLTNKSWLFQFAQPAYLISYYLPLLYGPLVYLFTLFYTDPLKKWKRIYLVHFVTFFIFLIAYAFPFDGRVLPRPIFFFFSNTGRLILCCASLVAYHAAALNLYRKNVFNANPSQRFRLRFLKEFSNASLSIGAAISFTLYYLYHSFPHNQDLRWIFVLLVLFIYWISYRVMQEPALFRVIRGNEQASTVELPIQVMKVHYPRARYAHSGLKDDEAQRIMNLLAKIMNEEKPYLDADYKLDDLVKRIECQKHHLSQVFNHFLRIGFSEYMNLKRIEAAKAILSDPAFKQWKVATVAYETGFNNISCFNEFFKKREGMTPSRYRDLRLSENRSRIRRG